eukprot:11115862-Alexandrium_andersonii.AAC.1
MCIRDSSPHPPFNARRLHPSTWPLARQQQRIVRIGGLADAGLGLAGPRFRDSGPPRGPLSRADSASARTATQNTPLQSFGDQI